MTEIFDAGINPYDILPHIERDWDAVLIHCTPPEWSRESWYACCSCCHQEFGLFPVADERDPVRLLFRHVAQHLADEHGVYEPRIRLP